MASLETRTSRLRNWFHVAARLADANDSMGRRARELLPATTGLSPEGIEYALTHCLEREPSQTELESVCMEIVESRQAHVLLSANVFTAPVRAIGLALAASNRVQVRASRREPLMTELLHELSQGAFELVNELMPDSGDQVWAYGRNETLAQISQRLPPQVVCHTHGTGFGAVVMDQTELERDARLAECLARDIMAFDQRGCLSPRVAFIEGPLAQARAFGTALMRELASLQTRVPLGRLTEDEAVSIARFRDSMTFAADAYFQAEGGSVAVVQQPSRLFIAPVGRQLLIVCGVDAAVALEPIAPQVTQLGLACSPALADRLKRALPLARVASVGCMQQPPFDGPVDKRAMATAS